MATTIFISSILFCHGTKRNVHSAIYKSRIPTCFTNMFPSLNILVVSASSCYIKCSLKRSSFIQMPGKLLGHVGILKDMKLNLGN